MSNHTAWPGFASALALLVAACAGDQPTDPGSIELARGGNATPLSATPGTLSLRIPTGTASGTVTARVQFVGVITASTSDAACATVSPLSLPATKPAGSSVYVATFTITAAGPGDCTVTLTDKRGGTATVQVQVREVPPVDGTRLLYAYSPEVLNSNVYGSNPDGSDVVTIADGEAEELWAVFTPDRSKIIFVSDEAGSLNLFRSNPDGTEREQMTFYEIGTHVGAGTLTPAVSPDGQQIAFVLSTGFFSQPTQIHVMDAIPGAAPVAITAGNAVHSNPSYAPDGRIVFAWASLEEEETDDGVLNQSIWIMAGNGANLTRLTNPGGAIHRDPTVSPDGTTIAFGSRGGFGEESAIALMDIDGQNQRALTSVGSDVDPVFSPDGNWIAFTRIIDPGVTGNAELFVLKLGRPESEAVNITNSEVDESQVDWR
jgi:Tol biopolymer transport system component